MGRNNVVNATNRCKCCLEEDGLKDMWKEHYSEGALEIYGDMIRDCFVMPWYPPLINKSEFICESCIMKLRVAVSFKKGMLLSDQTLKEYFDRESEPRVKLEADSDDDKDSENINIEYLEDEDSVDGIKREIKIELNKSDTQVSTYKTNDEYAQDDLNNYLEAVRSKTLMQVEKIETLSRSDTDSEYESDASAPSPSPKKTLRTENVHKKCGKTHSRQDFEPSETQSAECESRRGSPLQVTGDIAIEYYNNQMGGDNGSLTTAQVTKPRQNIGVRLKKVPKTAAERSREFRARKALLKKQKREQQEPDTIIKTVTKDIRSAAPSKDNQVPGPSVIMIIEKRTKSAEATRRWRENKKGVNGSSKKHPKTAAQRMREYRARKKLGNNKKERQKRYRERNREKLKQREVERRKRLQHIQSIPGPSTSLNTNTKESNNEDIK